MMISDAERREVARRLRELGGHVYHPDNVYELLVYALGVDDFEGTDELFLRLADLIEPSCDRDTPQKVAEEMFGKMRHSMKEEADAYDDMLKSKSVEIYPVDRDALLGLVKELELGAQCFVGRDWPNMECESMGKHLADDYEMIAHRIREALGVSDA